jgi:hypothetical protein
MPWSGESLLGGFVSIVDWVLAGAAVDMDFANGRYFGGALTDFLACTRASTAYALDTSNNLISFGVNIPRITNLGLLSEEARTNLLLQSQTLGTTWTVDVGSITADTTTAPDGTVTADTYSEDGTLANHGIRQNITLNASQTYSFSAYTKFVARQWVRFSFTGTPIAGDVWFDLQNSVVGSNAITTGTFVSASIASVAQGLVRISCTITTAAATATTTVRLWSANADADTAAVAGLNAAAWVAWGLQAELSNNNPQLPSTYIPTTTVTVTRAADTLTLTGNALTILQNNANGGAVLWMRNFQATPSAAAFQLANNGSTNRWFTTPGLNTQIRSIAAGISINATLGAGASFSSGALIKSAIGWSNAGRSLVSNNGTLVTDANAFAGVTTSVTFLPSNNAYAPRLALFSTRPSDTQLQTFSTP